MKKTAYIGRGFLQNFYSSLSYYIKSPLVLSTLRFIIPALVCGCQEIMADDDEIETKSVIMSQSGPPVKNMDIFMFEDGEMMILDSYQRIDWIHGYEVTTASRKGKRLAFVVANGQWNKEDWMSVNSYEALEKYRAFLENDSYYYPVMCGICHLRADSKQTIWMDLTCLCAEVILRSVRCDFSDKAYKNTTIYDLRAYLINVNAQCALTSDGTMMPERIINMGGINGRDMAGMQEPEMLLRYGGSLASGQSLELDFRFRCYPNNCPEESPGSPFTRLVLEGAIDGVTYYWPIDIGRNGNCQPDAVGVKGNTRYLYDVTITGKGGDNPDVPVSCEILSTNVKISEWREKEEYIIGF